MHTVYLKFGLRTCSLELENLSPLSRFGEHYTPVLLPPILFVFLPASLVLGNWSGHPKILKLCHTFLPPKNLFFQILHLLFQLGHLGCLSSGSLHCYPVSQFSLQRLLQVSLHKKLLLIQGLTTAGLPQWAGQIGPMSEPLLNHLGQETSFILMVYYMLLYIINSFLTLNFFLIF